MLALFYALPAQWLQTGKTKILMMKTAAVQGKASPCGAPETSLERSLSVKMNNSESVTVNGLTVGFMCLLTQRATLGP